MTPYLELSIHSVHNHNVRQVYLWYSTNVKFIFIVDNDIIIVFISVSDLLCISLLEFVQL